MQYFRSIGFSLALFLFFTAFISSQDKTQEKMEEIRPPVGLIRIDLLAVDKKKLNPPKRNIFIPNSSGRSEVEEFEYVSESQRTELENQNMEELEAEQLSARPFGLKYIGYVKSGKKITALILFEGEALAVDVGEEIAEGVSISKITLEEITVIGPTQEPWKFPLEGETL
ncbi:hypothetical protein ACFLRX_01805 [Acidobacteriota bacterium]